MCTEREGHNGRVSIGVYKKNQSVVLTEEHQSVCEID